MRRLKQAGAMALLLAGALTIARPAAAQQPAQPGNTVVERLIGLLVQKGVLPRDQADALLKQAEQEAKPPPKPAPVRHAPPPPALAVAKPASPAPSAVAAAKPATPGAAPEVPPGTVRVTYVPQIVRDQIADQVRTEVMQQAKTEGWGEPNVLPDWVRRITVFGDIRLRGEGDLFPSGNRGSGGNVTHFPDYQAINTGPAFDTNSGAAPPQLDTTADRERFRLRARLGVDAQIDDGIMGEIRIATGNDDSPVTANQTLGQNGPFTKYELWLDRAFIKATPNDWLTVLAGRTPNPFWTTDIMYYDELGFDGVSVSAKPQLADGLKGFITAGAFPVFNTAFNFATTGAPKESSYDAWLFAAQGGAEWQISKNYAFKLAAGYFDYTNTQGKLSSPCTIIFSSDSCSTDDSRPLFLQFGNTVFPIRDIVLPAGETTGPNPQYFGYASRFGVLDLHGRFDIETYRPVIVQLEGDFADNLAFNRSQILAEGPTADNFNGSAYKGGNKAYMVRLTVGMPEITNRWDWNVSVAYKYVESDAVLAALNDPDFHLGGTNAKGFVVGANLGIAHNTYLTLKLLSTNQIVGQPYGVDVVQADLNVRF